MVRYYLILLVGVAVLFSGCGNAGSAAKGSDSAEAKSKKLEFKLPTIPPMITGKENRRDYLAEHYWDDFEFADSVLVASDSIRGIATAGYIKLLEVCDSSLIKKSVNIALTKSLEGGVDAFEKLTSTFEKYLYDPNSPMRNEELYIFVLRHIVNEAKVDQVYKARPQFQLRLALKNRVGDVANDFVYTHSDGKKASLHSLKAKFTLLFFNNPDCGDCARVKKHIERSVILNTLVDGGEMKILALDPEADEALWRKTAYPKVMINGFDASQTITNDNLYDLKALPTLYLLSKDKRVVLKDCAIEDVESYLVSNLNS